VSAKNLIAVSNGVRLSCFQLVTDRLHETQAHHPQRVIACDLSKNGRVMSTLNEQRETNSLIVSLSVWDHDRNRRHVIPSLVREPAAIHPVAVTADGERIAYYSGIPAQAGGSVQLMNTKGTPTANQAFDRFASHLRFSSDHSLRLIVRNDLHTWLPLVKPAFAPLNIGINLKAMADVGEIVCFDTTSDRILVGTTRGFVLPLDEFGKPGPDFQACVLGRSPIRCLAISGDGNRAVAASDDRTIHVLDARRMQQMNSFRFNDAVTMIAFLGNGDWVTAGDGPVTVWTWSGGQAARKYDLPIQGSVHSLRAIQGDRLMVAVHGEYAVRVWDLAALEKRMSALNILTP
jgi:WD40 repeat protein